MTASRVSSTPVHTNPAWTGSEALVRDRAPAALASGDVSTYELGGYSGYKGPGYAPADVKTPFGAGHSALDVKSGSVDLGSVKSGSPFGDSNAAMDALGGGAWVDSDDIGAFFRSSYSYQDAARALEAFDFLGSIPEAKAYIGMKIKNGLESVLCEAGITDQPWDQHECMAAFEESRYSLSDARKAVAAFEFLEDVDDAKAYVGLKIINGSEDILAEAGIRPAESFLSYFQDGGYTEADAEKVLARFPEVVTIEGAKEYIGQKIAHGHEDELKAMGLGPEPRVFTREEALAAFRSSDYTRDDAFAAKRHFGLSTLDDARELIGRAVLIDDEASLRSAGIHPWNFDTHECLKAFKRSSYTASDAREAVKALSFLSSVREAKEYIGLKIANGTEDILAEVGITPAPFDRHECLDAYHSSAYTLADCDKLVAGADFISDRKEAKEYIGLKIINNYEEVLNNWGIAAPRRR